VGRLQGKSALVTAAGLGMGRAAVLELARGHARATATGLNPEPLSKSPAAVTTNGLDVVHG